MPGSTTFVYNRFNRSNFVCDICGEIFVDHQAWYKHVRAKHGAETVYKCGLCGELYKTIGSVSAHFVHCKEKMGEDRTPSTAPAGSGLGSKQETINIQCSLPTGRTVECPNCKRMFGSRSGLSLHVKSAHPETYNLEVSKKAERLTNIWSEEETAVMARLEADMPMNLFINQELLKLIPNRTLNGIKGKRRDPRYKELVMELRSKSNTQDQQQNIRLGDSLLHENTFEGIG